MPASTNPWIAYVKKYQRAHPSLSWGEALERAGPSYRAQKKGGAAAASKKKPAKKVAKKKATKKAVRRPAASLRSFYF